MIYRSACTLESVEIPDNASDLDIFKACVKVGLLRNQTFSALSFTVAPGFIGVDRTRDSRELLTLNKVKP